MTTFYQTNSQSSHPTDHMNEVVEKGIKAKLTPMAEDVTELNWLTVQEAPETKIEEDDNV